MTTTVSTTAKHLDERAREARRLSRRMKDGRRFISLRERVSLERSLRQERAIEYLLSPGDPALYHDQEAMTDVLSAAPEWRTR